MKIDGEHYVVVAERDLIEKYIRADNQADGPIVFETYLGEGSTKEGAAAFAARLGSAYGCTTIMRLVDPDMIDAAIEALGEIAALRLQDCMGPHDMALRMQEIATTAIARLGGKHVEGCEEERQ